MKRGVMLLIAWLTSTLLSACDATSSGNSVSSQQLGDSDARPVERGAGAAMPVDLRAAAEPFEALTKDAFDRDRRALDHLIISAQAKMQMILPTLPPSARREVDKDMAAIVAARQVDDRAAIALASIDIYRQCVQSAALDIVPVQVNLLDYAGFRFGADLEAPAPRWPDAIDAAALGQRQWSMIAAKVSDPSLRDRMTKAIAEMNAASAQRDMTRSALAVKDELDLVEILEIYFARSYGWERPKDITA